jgi:hypothetical protein
MATPEQKAAIDAAWARYRAETMAFPRNIEWSDYVARDARAFGAYLSTERAILAERKP